jgi:hypothetical protein
MKSHNPPDRPEPEDPPSAEELAAAESLRRALERGKPSRSLDPDWDLVEAIRAAAAPSSLASARQREILDTAMAIRSRGRVIYLAFGSVAAMAAAVALVVRASYENSPQSEAVLAASAPAALAVSRSAADLFPEGIPKAGGTSDRVDRIAYARARDLRENRFARWGVR